MSRGVVHRHGSDLALLWLWHRLAATALIRPLAWEPPYAADATLKKKKKKKKKTTTKNPKICNAQATISRLKDPFQLAIKSRRRPTS